MWKKKYWKIPLWALVAMVLGAGITTAFGLVIPAMHVKTGLFVSPTAQTGYANYTVGSSPPTSQWLIVRSTYFVLSVSDNASGPLSAFPSLAAINSSTIGYVCTSVNATSDTCTNWAYLNQQGWFYDAANQILYVHYKGGGPQLIQVKYKTG